MDRGYQERIIDQALGKAKSVPRNRALFKRRKKDDQKRTIFAIKYDPRLPSIQAIPAKHCTVKFVR